MKSDHGSDAHRLARATSRVAAMIPKIVLGAALVVLAVLPFNLAGSASPTVQGAQGGKASGNQLTGTNAAIGGGVSNTASAPYSTIGGRSPNTAPNTISPI